MLHSAFSKIHWNNFKNGDNIYDNDNNKKRGSIVVRE